LSKREEIRRDFLDGDLDRLQNFFREVRWFIRFIRQHHLHDSPEGWIWLCELQDDFDECLLELKLRKIYAEDAVEGDVRNI